MPFSSLRDIIEKFVQNPLIFSSYVCRIGEENIKKTLRISDVGVVSFKQGKLYVIAPGSVIAMEIRMHEARLLDAINQELGRKVVSKIVVKQ